MRVSEWRLLPIVPMLLLGLAVVLLASCDLSPSRPTAPDAEPTETPATPDEPEATPDSADATPQAPTAITLTIWTTEAFSPTESITTGRILAQQVALFEESHPDVRVRFVPKKAYGQGGLLDYLQNTATVVPDLLPDLVFIDVDELGIAVDAEVAQPLDDLVSPDLVADLYPFARQAATFDGRLYGLQFQADLEHLVYDTGKVTIPPSSWPGVLSNPEIYTFPAGGAAGLVNDAFVIQYLGVRAPTAELGPEDPFLDEDSLVAVLGYYQDGSSRGIFPAEILSYHSTEEVWHDYLDGQAALAQVNAHEFLIDRGELQSSAVAPIPGISGPVGGIGQGWALSLITPDPARQTAAVDFMTQLMAPEVNAAWNHAASYLPTRQEALAHWDEADSYTLFIQEGLAAARPRPKLSHYAQVAGVLQQAVEKVLTGEATPEEAAAEVMENAQ
jgi:multiple sugar transport system substrate-binding protein